MKLGLNLLLILLVNFLFLGTQSANAEQLTYSFGIVPQQSASKLARLWGPILKQIGEKTGYKLRFTTAPDIPTFEKRLSEGEYDFAYMNPYHYTTFHDRSGYQALAKARNKRIKGIIVVRKDSGIEELGDLDSSTLAFPAPAAFAASILTRANLSSSGVSFKPKYVSSHDSVYRTVAKGLYPAGGGVIRTLNNVSPEIRQQLRVLWTSQGYTPHAIAVHPRVADEDAKHLQQELVQLDQHTEQAALLKNIKIKGFEIAEDSDWDDVRGLELKELSHM
ncbi:MAG: phosphate/phosphite/phosphonate ABC transporter substrate-binding protein [Gammaproteobacteria bacterium]|nr:phosphate/phosphite/phosphonate ABC transporter substrate-binding protein [Gammaproteobacteria bacterium]